MEDKDALVKYFEVIIVAMVTLILKWNTCTWLSIVAMVTLIFDYMEYICMWLSIVAMVTLYLITWNIYVRDYLLLLW